MRHTPRLQEIVKAAELIAAQMGRESAGVEHIQLAILGDPDAVPTQVLETYLGVPRHTYATHLLTVLNGKGYNT